MDWRNKWSEVLLIIVLLIYFARSFPVLTHYQTNPELGPYFEGDIKSNPWDRNGMPNEIHRWKKGILKFYLQDDYSFEEIPDEPTCAADVGFRGRRQVIDLAPSCVAKGHGIAVHETLHALGFYHEQSREDRDDYVTINLNNVLPTNKHNFNMFPSNAFGVP
ncbi:unnamed protein product, partial [Allacma fusca]